MIKSLLQLLAVIVIGILLYNYFMGSSDEKSNAQKIFKEVKDVGVEVGKLLKSEKEKFDRGKYDEALRKIDKMFEGLKSKAKDFDKEYLPKIEQLEKKAKELETQINKAEEENKGAVEGEDGVETKKLKEELDSLLERTKRLVQDMETKE